MYKIILIISLTMCSCSGGSFSDGYNVFKSKDDDTVEHASTDSVKPTDGSEGIPGYLVDPELISLIVNQKNYDIKGEPQTVTAPEGRSVTEAFMHIYAVNDQATYLRSTQIKEDGSFEISLEVSDSKSLALVLGSKDRKGETIEVEELNISLEIQVNPDGMWISALELQRLPDSGPAWDFLKATADETLVTPTLSDFGNKADMQTFAKALVFARTGEQKYKDEAIVGIMSMIDTEGSGSTLDVGEKLKNYILSAQLVQLPEDKDQVLKDFLRRILTKDLSGRTLQSTQEDRPLQWGTHAGATRAAIAAYLGDQNELQATAKIFRGFLGDRSSHADFNYGNDMTWHPDPNTPYAINPLGSEIDGHSISGAITDAMRDGGSFKWPPEETSSPWATLTGAIALADILERSGYPDVWMWQDHALLRSIKFLDGLGWQPANSRKWLLWIVDKKYGTSYTDFVPTQTGRTSMFSSWTHSK